MVNGYKEIKITEDWPNIIKCIAIYFVILGHFVQKKEYLCEIAYSINNPFFFIIAGYFAYYSLKKYNYIIFTYLRFRRAVIPYLFWSIIGAIARYIRDGISFPHDISFKCIVSMILDNVINAQSVWFYLAYCLIMIMLMMGYYIENKASIRMSSIIHNRTMAQFLGNSCYLLVWYLFYIIPYIHLAFPQIKWMFFFTFVGYLDAKYSIVRRLYYLLEMINQKRCAFFDLMVLGIFFCMCLIMIYLGGDKVFAYEDFSYSLGWLLWCFYYVFVGTLLYFGTIFAFCMITKNDTKIFRSKYLLCTARNTIGIYPISIFFTQYISIFFKTNIVLNSFARNIILVIISFFVVILSGVIHGFLVKNKVYAWIHGEHINIQTKLVSR